MADKTITFQCDLKRFQKDIVSLCDNEEQKYLVVIASRQIGKSFVLRLQCMKWLFSNKNDVAYVTLTNRLGKKFYKAIKKSIPDALIKESDSTQLIIETTNGSTISFLSIEGIENVRGLTFSHMVIDECAFARETTPDGQNIWQNILSPTLDAKGRKAVFISTPFGRSGLFYESVVKGESKDHPNWSLVKATIYDDETKTPEWIEEKRRELTDKAFRQEYCCEFVDDGASYFQGFSQLFVNNDKKLEGNVWCGIDFSDTGEDETIVTFEDEQGNVEQHLIEGTRDAKYQKIADLINSQPNLMRCYAEKNSMGGVMLNEILKLVKPHLKGKIEEFATTSQSKPEMIKLLAKDIEGGRLYFERKNIDLLSQFGTFVATINPNTKSVRYAASIGHDDRVMSLAICHLAKAKNLDNRVVISFVRR